MWLNVRAFVVKNILIFGGSGFIGSELAKSLLEKDNIVCVVCTNKEKALSVIGNHKNLQITKLDIFDKDKLSKLLQGYDVVINLIGKLFESNKGDFEIYHHDFPDLLSKCVLVNQHLIHLSALGIANSSKTSKYAKTKLDGQNSVIKNSNNYNIISPSIVFGENDNFFNQFARMSKISPFLPLIGNGKAKFAPIYVKDLVKTIIFLIEDNKKHKNELFEAYGPDILDFKEILQFILKTTRRKRILLNLPFFVAKIQAKLMNLLKIYLLTPDQVELLKYDNIASNNYDNIDKITGALHSYKDIVPKYLK